MDVSDDGSTMYVGLVGATSVAKVDLNARGVTQSFSLSDPWGGQVFATDIAIQPGGTSTIAVTTASPFDSGTYGPAIYDDGVRRPNMLGTYEGTQVEWTAPDRVVSYNGSHTGSELIAALVDENGATITKVVREGFSAFTAEMTLAGNRLYGSDGSVVNATNLQRIGTFAVGLDLASAFGPAVETTRNRAHFALFAQDRTAIETFNPSTFTLVKTSLIDVPTSWPSYGPATDVISWGVGKIAFQNGSKVYFVEDLP
jgi:hypothetical protein